MTEASNKAKIAHNIGLATWFGGALFGQIALNPTIERISDKNERGRVLNEAWGRFNAANFPAIAATLLTWRLGGLKADAELRAPALTRIKNLLLGGAAVTGIASESSAPGSPSSRPRATRRSSRERSLPRRPPGGVQLSAPDLADRPLQSGPPRGRPRGLRRDRELRRQAPRPTLASLDLEISAARLREIEEGIPAPGREERQLVRPRITQTAGVSGLRSLAR
jgi:hypothetical protein